MLHLAPTPRNPPVTDHKVSVRWCAGWDCPNTVVTHKVRQNVRGHRQYCSLVCYSRWSPEMREKVALYPEYEQSPSGLETLIIDLKVRLGVDGTAEELHLSRSTVSYWLRKLQSFRHFAGQSPEQIMALLSEVADQQGIRAAALMIQVDPKTLKRALEKNSPTEQAAA